MDSLLFTYRDNRCTDDAGALALHFVMQHLEFRNKYARILFADYNSAFLRNYLTSWICRHSTCQYVSSSWITACYKSFVFHFSYPKSRSFFLYYTSTSSVRKMSSYTWLIVSVRWCLCVSDSYGFIYLLGSFVCLFISDFRSLPVYDVICNRCVVNAGGFALTHDATTEKSHQIPETNVQRTRVLNFTFFFRISNIPL